MMFRSVRRQRIGLVARGCFGLVAAIMATPPIAADGVLRLRVRDEATDRPVVSRVVVKPVGKDRSLHLRRSEPAGVGVVLDREVDISLRDGAYRFELIRGPEYRILDGTFTLEKLSDDVKSVAVVRMVDMAAEGWVSGDAMVTAVDGNLPLRMAAEDLHVALVESSIEPKNIRSPRSADDPIEHRPLWIEPIVTEQNAFAIYAPRATDQTDDADGTDQLIRFKRDPETNVAVTEPTALPMPVWLASGKLDGVFVMRDRPQNAAARANSDSHFRIPEGALSDRRPGRVDEWVFHQMLEAGFEIPPLAGGVSSEAKSPLGYNRLYVAGPDSPPQNAAEWISGMWGGRCVLTNGPMLRCRVNDRLPGEVFEIDGETRFNFSLSLAVRDPVDYLDIIHNGNVFYSAPLDEFARRGGQLPPLITDQPGWVIVRVVTKIEDHYRFAMTAPWYIHVRGQRRCTDEAIGFWQSWLASYESTLRQDPKAMATEAKYIPATRRFWQNRRESLSR